MTYRIATSGLALFLLAGTAFLAVGGPANAASNTTMSACSDQWQAAKKAGTIPQGESWPMFYSGCAASMKNGASAATSTGTAAATKKKAASTTLTTPAKKKATAAKAPASPNDTRNFVPNEPTATDRTAAVTTDAKGKPLSAGEIAFRQRIRECSRTRPRAHCPQARSGRNSGAPAIRA